MSIKIKEEYEKQIDFPKPIIIKIFNLLELRDIYWIHFCCKQFYFILQSDTFWKIMVNERTEYEKVDLEVFSKTKTYKKIFIDSLIVWDLESSDREFLIFNDKVVNHNKNYNLATAFTKKKIHCWTKMYALFF
eukprot:TRINITY_DN7218_c0_g1_i1.p1 TRINITY_DN7218_c0_g1~~TRINITY_DN7218_c0_g1_i1.p1  ORF type:complete len:144 (-),score=32.23 TRINITY_DN7218_c0_g1_i1:406-804(-)